MIIVPIAGDSLKTDSGLPFKVLSFTNYKEEGPALLVQSMSSTSPKTVFFDEVTELNSTKVRLLVNAEGYKVFETDGYFERKHHLPQVGEIVLSGVSGIETREYEVSRIRVHVKNNLSSGMILDCIQKDTDEVVQMSLRDISDIKKGIFKRNSFLKQYADYLPKGTA